MSIRKKKKPNSFIKANLLSKPTNPMAQAFLLLLSFNFYFILSAWMFCLNVLTVNYMYECGVHIEQKKVSDIQDLALQICFVAFNMMLEIKHRSSGIVATEHLSITPCSSYSERTYTPELKN